jgi:RNA polymerase sigma-70 factor (ECF subfamily)
LTGALVDILTCKSAAPESDPSGDEAALIWALRRNDAAAYETLVRRFGGRMLAAARRYLPGEQDCADAVQDAFVSAFQAIDDFKGNAQLGSWLHRIVINACLMKVRSRSRRHEVSIEGLLPTFDASGHHAQAVPRWAQPPQEQLESDESRALVRRHIEMLPDDYRTVLLLRDIEEFSTEEAAVALQITPGAVKTRLHRARQALRTLLEPLVVP